MYEKVKGYANTQVFTKFECFFIFKPNIVLTKVTVFKGLKRNPKDNFQDAERIEYGFFIDEI